MRNSEIDGIACNAIRLRHDAESVIDQVRRRHRQNVFEKDYHLTCCFEATAKSDVESHSS